MSVPELPSTPIAGAVHPVVVDATLVPEVRGAAAFLSNVRRDGDWLVPRLFRAVAVWGNIELDLTSARVGAGVSHIEVVSVMGGVTVLIPPELRVECEGGPIIGSFDVKRDVASSTAPDAPQLVISGYALMGSVTIKVIDPNATKWYDKLRARLTRRKSPPSEG